MSSILDFFKSSKIHAFEVYQSLFNQITDTIFIYDLDGIILETNTVMERISGREKEELRNQPIQTFIYHGDVYNFSSTLKQLRKGVSQELELYLKHKNGEYIQLNLSLIPIKQNAKILGVIGIGKDITVQKKQERELRQIRGFLNDSQMLGNIGSWDYDVIEDEAYWSKHLFHIFGFPEDSPFIPTYNSFLALIHPEDHDLLNDAYTTSLKNGSSMLIEIRAFRQNGEERILKLQGDVLLDENGKAIRLIGTVQDITERHYIEEKVNYLTYHDPLTEVPNRRMFDKNLYQTIRWAKETNERFAVFYLNLDRFNIINKTLGYSIGDELLKEVSRRLIKAVTKKNLVARMDGDEFAIIISGLSQMTEGENLAKKILQSIEKPFYINGNELYMTASMGISFFPEHGKTVDGLMNNTIAALQLAKRLLKNNYQFYSPNMKGQLYKFKSIEKDMRKALKNNEYVVYYQPRVCANTGKILSAEALVRWNHPEYGFLPPIDFIPVAEETGLILKIGDWVTNNVCNHLKQWQEEGLSITPISINISAQGFLRNDVVSKIKSILNETNTDPAFIELEITESSYINNMEKVIQDLSELRKMGIKIALDDFGTGFSSLTHLRDLNIDTLKIDRSFIKHITEKKQDQVITSSIIQLAKGLNIDVVAEGVETLEQLELLKKKGCSQIQGFLFSKPIPTNEFKVLLEKGHIDLSENGF